MENKNCILAMFDEIGKIFKRSNWAAAFRGLFSNLGTSNYIQSPKLSSANIGLVIMLIAIPFRLVANSLLQFSYNYSFIGVALMPVSLTITAAIMALLPGGLLIANKKHFSGNPMSKIFCMIVVVILLISILSNVFGFISALSWIIRGYGVFSRLFELCYIAISTVGVAIAANSYLTISEDL